MTSVSTPVADRSPGRAAPAGWAVVTLGIGLLAAGATGGLTGAVPALLGATLARAGTDVAAVVCAGAALLTLLAPDGARTGADRVLRGASAAWLALGLLDLLFRSALVADRPVSAVRPADVTEFVTGPAAGTGIVLGIGAAALVLGCSLAGPLTPGQGAGPAALTLLLTVAGLAAPVATGHAEASGAVLPVVAATLHAPAAALWVGGLGAMLVVAGRPDVLGPALPRFSRVATVALAVLTISGVVAATARIHAPSGLLTPYGGLVLAKVGCLAVAASLGGLTRRRLHAGRTPVLVWAGVEILVLAVAVGLAATLTQTA